MNRRQAHRASRLRELVDVVSFFGVIVLIVLFLSLDNVR